MGKIKVGKGAPVLSCRSAQLVLAVLCTVQSVLGQTYCEEKPKILFYRKGQAALVSGGGSASDNLDDSNHVVISNVNKEFLACVSSRNVEWAYDGDGEPSKFQESSNVDIQKYDDGSISYCLTSQITFSNKQSDTELSRHTGRYSCREIGNATNTASVYVFASRRNSPAFLQSRKTLTFPLTLENITTIAIAPMKPILKRKVRGDSNLNGTRGNSNDENKEAIVASDLVSTPILTIPCATTHPNITVRLYKKGGSNSNRFTPYKGVAHVFDPKHGFRLNASLTKLEEFYGEYKCVSSANARLSASLVSGSSGGRSMEQDLINRNTEDFVLITLQKHKPFQAFPPENEVYTSGMLNLTCESEEPVIMKEVLPHTAQDIYAYLDEDDYGRDRSDDIVETTEKTEQKTHVANYMEISPEPGRSGEIQCLTEKDAKILHTWKYRIIRKRAEKLSGIKFNKRENSFTCKSKLGAPGRLSFVSCRTPSECRVNRICLTKSENCRGYSNATRAFCERKTHFCGKIFYRGGSGLIRCIGEGIDEIRGFTDEAAADQVVRMGFGRLKASETALFQLDDKPETLENNGVELKAQKENGSLQQKLILEGDQVSVKLQMGYYYFLYPVQWAVKYKNGSTTQLSPENQTLKVEKLTRAVYASLRLPYTSATTFLSAKTPSNNGTSTNTNTNKTIGETEPLPLSEIVALHALIPLRSSVEPSWKTISLPLTVYGKIGLPPLPFDNDGEDLIAEQFTNDDKPSSGDASSSSALQSQPSALEDEEDTEMEGEDEEDDVESAPEQPKETPQAQEAGNQTNAATTTVTSVSPLKESDNKTATQQTEQEVSNSINTTSPVSTIKYEQQKEEATTEKVGYNLLKTSIEESTGNSTSSNSSLSITSEIPLSSLPPELVISSSTASVEEAFTNPPVNDPNNTKESADDDAKVLARSSLLLDDYNADVALTTEPTQGDLFANDNNRESDATTSATVKVSNENENNDAVVAISNNSYNDVNNMSDEDTASNSIRTTESSVALQDDYDFTTTVMA